VEPISTIGVLAAAVVAKVYEKALDRTADAVVEGAKDSGSDVVAWLRGKLSSSRELDLVAQAPDSALLQTRLGELIDQELIDAGDLAELRRLVEATRAEAELNGQNAVGHHIVQASNSTVQVSWTESPEHSE
jgi:hypothetical protein